MRFWVVGLGLVSVLGCGGSSVPPASQASADDEAVLRDPVLDAIANEDTARRPTRGVPNSHRDDEANDAASRSHSTVGVRGITGSLTAFEVAEAMQTRNDALMACVQQRPTRLGHVAGEIRFHMEVDPRGKADRVRITQSDIGFADLERCLADVVAGAPFPAPAGQERAEAAWRMSVDPLSRGAEPIDATELEEALTRQADATYEACTVEKNRRFAVTGYINKQGKMSPVSVLSQWRGARQTHDDTPEELACLMQSVAAWNHLPKRAQHSKTSFELHWVAAPEPVRARNRNNTRNRSNKPRKRRS